MKHLFLPALLGCLWLPVLVSCTIDFKDVMSLENDIRQKYHCNEIRIDPRSRLSLLVTITNSPYNDSSKQFKEQMSRDIGQMVRHYPKLAGPLREGQTRFARYTDSAQRSTSSTEIVPMHLRDTTAGPQP